MTKQDFVIEKISDGSYRITRTDVTGDLHSHVKNRKIANVIVHNVINGNIPLNSRSYTLESMYRLSTDENYKRKIKDILKIRNQKGNKEKYINSRKKF